MREVIDNREVVIEGNDADGWTATVPEVPGVTAYGRTLAALRENVREALEMKEELEREEAPSS